jgi:hypothetical protein
MIIYLVNERVDLGYNTLYAFKSKETAERCRNILMEDYCRCGYAYVPLDQYNIQEIEISPDESFLGCFGVSDERKN